MIPEIVIALTERITEAAIIQKAYGLGILSKTNNIQEPLVFEGDEPLHVDFDKYESVSFFLLNGPVTQVQRDNDISCGAWVAKRVPLRLIFFSTDNAKKSCIAINEDASANLIQTLVFQQDKALCSQFGVASISLAVTAQELRPDLVWEQVFGNKQVMLTDDQQLLSIDFDLLFEGNPACWNVPCAA